MGAESPPILFQLTLLSCPLHLQHLSPDLIVDSTVPKPAPHAIFAAQPEPSSKGQGRDHYSQEYSIATLNLDVKPTHTIQDSFVRFLGPDSSQLLSLYSVECFSDILLAYWISLNFFYVSPIFAPFYFASLVISTCLNMFLCQGINQKLSLLWICPGLSTENNLHSLKHPWCVIYNSLWRFLLSMVKYLLQTTLQWIFPVTPEQKQENCPTSEAALDYTASFRQAKAM